MTMRDGVNDELEDPGDVQQESTREWAARCDLLRPATHVCRPQAEHRRACRSGSIWIHEAAISSLSLDTSSKSRYRIRKSHAPNPGPSSCPDTLSQLPPPPPPVGLVADPTSRHVVPIKVTTFPGLPHLRVSLPDAPFVLFRAHFRPQLRYRSFL